MTTRINLWSGPRNISTALMYSFAQRNDTQVVDEPLYAHYLSQTGIWHPGRDEILQSQCQDGLQVIEDIILGNCARDVLFLKQMTHHLVNIPLDFMKYTKNLILIRDPGQVLVSYAKVIDQPTLSDIGIRQSFELYNYLTTSHYHCEVLDSNEVLKNPESVLSKTCERLGIPFDKAMLSWPSGPRPEDGVWAPYWYQNVHKSQGFQPFRDDGSEIPERLKPLWEEALPFYLRLQEKSIKA